MYLTSEPCMYDYSFEKTQALLEAKETFIRQRVEEMMGIVEAIDTINKITEEWPDEFVHALAKGISGGGYETLNRTVESLCRELARKEWEEKE